MRQVHDTTTNRIFFRSALIPIILAAVLALGVITFLSNDRPPDQFTIECENAHLTLSFDEDYSSTPVSDCASGVESSTYVINCEVPLSLGVHIASGGEKTRLKANIPCNMTEGSIALICPTGVYDFSVSRPEEIDKLERGTFDLEC